MTGIYYTEKEMKQYIDKMKNNILHFIYGCQWKKDESGLKRVCNVCGKRQYAKRICFSDGEMYAYDWITKGSAEDGPLKEWIAHWRLKKQIRTHLSK